MAILATSGTTGTGIYAIIPIGAMATTHTIQDALVTSLATITTTTLLSHLTIAPTTVQAMAEATAL